MSLTHNAFGAQPQATSVNKCSRLRDLYLTAVIQSHKILILIFQKIWSVDLVHEFEVHFYPEVRAGARGNQNPSEMM